MVGVVIVDVLHAIRVDVCVFGICSLHFEVGVMMLDHEELYVKRVMVVCLGEMIVIVMVDKLCIVSLWVVVLVGDVVYLVIDGDVDLMWPYVIVGVDVVAA